MSTSTTERRHAERDAAEDPLLAFDSETHTRQPVRPAASPRANSDRRFPLRKYIAAALTLALVVVVLDATVMFLRRPSTAQARATTSASARLTIETTPPAAEVVVDGQSRGAAPLALALPAGTHAVVLRQGQLSRAVTVTLQPGADRVEHVELAAPSELRDARARAAAARAATMSVSTDPPDARVEVDGRPQGKAPLTISDLTPSTHKVRVIGEHGSIERTVSVGAGAALSLVFTLPKASAPAAAPAPSAGPAIGWIAVSAPFPVDISDNGTIIGTGANAKIAVAAGARVVDLSNDALGYRDTRRIEVTAGKVAVLQVNAPNAPVSLNATPWADVQVDGAMVAQTPVANLPMSLGEHTIVYRHPQLGTATQKIVVTAAGPNRFAVVLSGK